MTELNVSLSLQAWIQAHFNAGCCVYLQIIFLYWMMWQYTLYSFIQCYPTGTKKYALTAWPINRVLKRNATHAECMFISMWIIKTVRCIGHYGFHVSIHDKTHYQILFKVSFNLPPTVCWNVTLPVGEGDLNAHCYLKIPIKIRWAKV